MTLIAQLLRDLSRFWTAAYDGDSNDAEHDAAVELAVTVQTLLVALGEEPYTQQQALEEVT